MGQANEQDEIGPGTATASLDTGWLGTGGPPFAVKIATPVGSWTQLGNLGIYYYRVNVISASWGASADISYNSGANEAYADAEEEYSVSTAYGWWGG